MGIGTRLSDNNSEPLSLTTPAHRSLQPLLFPSGHPSSTMLFLQEAMFQRDMAISQYFWWKVYYILFVSGLNQKYSSTSLIIVILLLIFTKMWILWHKVTRVGPSTITQFTSLVMVWEYFLIIAQWRIIVAVVADIFSLMFTFLCRIQMKKFLY